MAQHGGGQAPDDPQRGWLRRQLMKVFGPPDLGPEHRGNPLKGTKYDPAVKRAEKERRRRRPPDPAG